MNLILTWFDVKIGPKIFFTYPNKISKEVEDIVLSLMDIRYKDACFDFLPEKKKGIRLVNYMFEIPSAWTRGKREFLMLTGMFDRKTNVDFIRHKIWSLAQAFKADKEIYKGFYYQDKPVSDVFEKFMKIKKILFLQYDGLDRKLNQMNILDRLFEKEPVNQESETALVFKSLAKTLITCIDAQKYEGAKILYDAGSMLAQKYEGLFHSNDVDVLLEEIAKFWRRHSLGEIDEVHYGESSVNFSIYDCFECQHRDNIGRTLCKFDEGFLTTLLFNKSGRVYQVNELDCFAKGSDHCLFTFEPKKDAYKLDLPNLNQIIV